MPDNMYRKTKSSSTKGLEKFLGELQLVVMEIIWEHQPISVAGVITVLNHRDRNLAYTTVMTIMGRLAEKGWLVAEKQGRTYFYHAVRSRQEAEAAAVGEVVRALLQDFGEVVVAQLVKELEVMDPNQLARLAELARESEPKDDKQA